MGRMGKHYHSWFCAFLDLWSAPNVRFGMDTRVRLAGTLRWSWRTGQVGMFSYEQHSFGNQDQSFPRLSNSVPSACVTFTSLPEHLYVPRAAEGMRRGKGATDATQAPPPPTSLCGAIVTWSGVRRRRRHRGQGIQVSPRRNVIIGGGAP